MPQQSYASDAHTPTTINTTPDGIVRKEDIFMNELGFPEDLLYHPEHTWLKFTDDGALVGISDFAQEQLGEVAFVDLPSIGARFTAGEEFGTVESIKAVSGLHMPVDGTVEAINEKLTSEPSLVNTSPYGEGWLLKITLLPSADTANLLSSQKYKEQTQ